MPPAKQRGEGDMLMRIIRLETTVNDQVVPSLADLGKRTAYIESWLWRAIGAIGIISFLAALALKLFK